MAEGLRWRSESLDRYVAHLAATYPPNPERPALTLIPGGRS
jgi:hypothetical protein